MLKLFINFRKKFIKEYHHYGPSILFIYNAKINNYPIEKLLNLNIEKYTNFVTKIHNLVPIFKETYNKNICVNFIFFIIYCFPELKHDIEFTIKKIIITYYGIIYKNLCSNI